MYWKTSPSPVLIGPSSRSTPSGRFARALGSGEVDSILHLQRTIGNQAVQRLLQAEPVGTEVGSGTKATARVAYDFSRIPVHSQSSVNTQPKLTVNTPGDSYRHEADRVSEQVMRMPESQLQRACAYGGGCTEHRAEQPDQEHERLQTRRAGLNDLEQTAVLPIVHEVLRSPGQPLDPAMRAFMEPRFGHDFARVRVHTDAKAAEAAQAVSALAYTVGRHVVLGGRRPSPKTIAGQHLLAHELAHVVQQSRGGPPPDVAPPAPHESDARTAAMAVATGLPSVRITCHTGVGLARQPDDDPHGKGFIASFPPLDFILKGRQSIRGKITSFLASGAGDLFHNFGVGPKSDWAGRAILERYMAGGGDWYIRNDRKWKGYMMESEHLRKQVLEEFTREVLPQFSKGVGTYLFFRRFQPNTGESSATPSGYGYLNGTNWDAGGFEMYGVYSVYTPADGGWVVTARLEFDWGDKIDPNGLKDLPGDILAYILSEGERESYTINIHWDSLTRLQFDLTGSLKWGDGYPGAMRPNMDPHPGKALILPTGRAGERGTEPSKEFHQYPYPSEALFHAPR